VRDCIETAEKWARNEATLEALQVSRRNCYPAYAADVAVAVAAHAAAYAYAADRSKTLAQCADIVRTFYKEPPV
jgi:hypothetical protein